MADEISYEIDIDEDVIDEYWIDAIDAMWKTAEALHTDLVQSQTMPRDSGHMQNESTSVEGENGNYEVVTNTDYAKRLYYHPEYNFNRYKNPNAGAYWFKTYITGDKKNFVEKTFKKFMQMKKR